MAGVPREAQRLVTLSERSDEGSQGAHSMSVSVSSQPSVSGVNSEDGDRESSHPRDDDCSLREFPVDELEPVNLDDVRVFRMRYPRGAFSGTLAPFLAGGDAVAPEQPEARRRASGGFRVRRRVRDASRGVPNRLPE